MSKICNLCGDEIHPGRVKALPTATTCVSCSTTGKKAGVTVTLGEGDHTYNEIIIMEHDEFVKYKEIEAAFRNKGVVTPTTEIFNLDDESDVDRSPEINVVEDNEDLIVLDELVIESDDLIDESEENA
jgi:hypothetical protein